MFETPFIITIDTEGDDLWARPREITTRNAEYLPRFQSLCERFGFKPVYLTNHEMAMSDVFVEFGRDVVARGAGEIGMHLHAWNSPPLVPLTGDDFRFQPYLIEYPETVMREKIGALTRLLEDRFDCRMVSHRAGRWAFDGRYAAMLIEEGYRVDCSVTPGVDWRGNPGDPRGSGGSDYTDFPGRPYFLDPSDISAPAPGALLEVPMTIRPSDLYRGVPGAYRIPLVRRAANWVSPGLSWLCPIQPALRASLDRNFDATLRMARATRAEGTTHMEFMLHSSELMPGGSPTLRSASSIDRLYEHLEMLFEGLSAWCRGMTLKEFHASFGNRRPRKRQAPEDAGAQLKRNMTMKPDIAPHRVAPPVRGWLDETSGASPYVCPDCKTPLDGLRCGTCSREYVRHDGIPVLLSSDPRFQPAVEISRSYDAIYREHHNAWENQGRTPAFIDCFSSLLGGFGRDRFLEIGCGEGFLLSALDQGEKFAVDLSTRAISAARTRAQAQFSVALAERLPFPDGHFDLVASVGVMEHFLDIGEATREIRRVLSPGGHYIALTHVHLELAEKLGHKLREYVFPVPRPLRFARWLKGKLAPPAYPRQVIQHKFTISSAASSLEDNGLKVIDILHTGKYPELPLINPSVVIYVAQKQGRA